VNRLRCAYALIQSLQAGTALADAATHYAATLPRPQTPAERAALDALSAACVRWLNTMEIAQPVLAAEHELQQTLLLGGRPTT
jgi:hypothetical protein